MSRSVCQWGILGTAEIAQKNWRAIWNSRNATLVGVASRSGAKAADFVERCQQEAPFRERPRVLDDYASLLSDPEIDAVYIPLPTGIRKEWVVRAAEAGKHVLSEKPAAPDVATLEDMLNACHHHGVQWMDGVMFYHSARLKGMAGCVGNEEFVGPVRRIATQFSFPAPGAFFRENIRVQQGLEPLGVLGDLGWYCIGLSLWAMTWELPLAVKGRIHSQFDAGGHADGVPIEFSGELIYANGVSAGFYCSFQTGHQQWAHISGTEGYLMVPDFVLPYAGEELQFKTNRATYEIRGCDFRMQPCIQRHWVSEASHGSPTAQETQMFKRFSDLVLSGERDQTWAGKSWKVQKVVDGCLNSARHDGKEVKLNVGA